MSTDQPNPDATTGPEPPSVPPLPPPVAVLLAALSVVMIVGGGVVVITRPALPALVPVAGPRSMQAKPQFPGLGPAGTTSGGTAPAGTTPAPPQPAPTGPDALARLSRTRATAELKRRAAADADQVAALAGSWVPQVSSKCAGLKVDIGPDWLPDGRAETHSVSTAQIAAFHASLRARFGALTALPTAIGIDHDKGTHGPCAGRAVWMSLVPQSFSGPAAANAWCDTEGLPRRECGARSVAPGGRSRFVARD
jgi:hypothetical protein